MKATLPSFVPSLGKKAKWKKTRETWVFVHVHTELTKVDVFKQQMEVP